MNQFERMFRGMPPVTKNLVIINFIIWIAMAIFPQIDHNVMKYCALHFYQATDFNVVQLFTYMFVHGGLMHILFNMLTLFMFGITLEYVMGSRRFLIFYIVCGVGAALIQEAVWAVTLPDMVVDGLARLNSMTPDEIRALMARDPSIMADNLNFFSTVGASGAIYGVLLAFAMLFPNRPLYFMFLPVPVKAKWMVLIWGGMEILLGISAASDGVAHFAHLGGMIFGFMLIAYWKKKGTIHGDIY